MSVSYLCTVPIHHQSLLPAFFLWLRYLHGFLDNFVSVISLTFEGSCLEVSKNTHDSDIVTLRQQAPEVQFLSSDHIGFGTMVGCFLKLVEEIKYLLNLLCVLIERTTHPAHLTGSIFCSFFWFIGNTLSSMQETG